MNERINQPRSPGLHIFQAKGGREEAGEIIFRAMDSYEKANKPRWDEAFVILEARDRDSFDKGVATAVMRIFIDIVQGSLVIQAGRIEPKQITGETKCPS